MSSDKVVRPKHYDVYINLLTPREQIALRVQENMQSLPGESQDGMFNWISSKPADMIDGWCDLEFGEMLIVPVGYDRMFYWTFHNFGVFEMSSNMPDGVTAPTWALLREMVMDSDYYERYHYQRFPEYAHEAPLRYQVRENINGIMDTAITRAGYVDRTGWA